MIHLASLPPECFTGLTMTKPPSPRPLSIKVIAIFFLTTIPAGLFPIWLNEGAFLGFPVHGPLLVLITLSTMGLQLFVGIGVWRLKDIARKVAIWLQIFIVTNLWLYTFSPSFQEAAQSTADKYAALLGIAAVQVDTSIRVLLTSAIQGSILPILILYFLIKRKSAFAKK